MILNHVELISSLALLVVLGCTPNQQMPQPSLQASIKIVQDPSTSDDEAMRAIESLRSHGLDEIPLSFWTRVGNGESYTPLRRESAIVQGFDRYVQLNWTLGQCGKALDSPTWLALSRISYMSPPKAGAGLIPPILRPWGPNQSVLRIETDFPVKYQSSILLRITGKASLEHVYTALIGKSSSARDLQINEIQLGFYDARTIGGMDWRR